MQRKIVIIAGLLISSLYSGIVKAQQPGLVPNQNPRYKESQRKYSLIADSINNLHGTTLQNTYKAFDWYDAKQERRRQNREWRHEERMNDTYSYPSFYPYLNYQWGGGYGSWWGGHHRFGLGYGW